MVQCDSGGSVGSVGIKGHDCYAVLAIAVLAAVVAVFWWAKNVVIEEKTDRKHLYSENTTTKQTSQDQFDSARHEYQ
jgi:hypothetical protein